MRWRLFLLVSFSFHLLMYYLIREREEGGCCTIAAVEKREEIED